MKIRSETKILLNIAVGIACAINLGGVFAQTEKSSTDSIAEYRAMLQDGNPADLFVAKGEDLWKQKRGPKNQTLQQCDLGKGPGVVKGAFVELPRYFPDTKRVQDLESRLLTCMEKIQGFNAKKIAETPFGKDEQKNMEAYVAWIASESQGMKLNLPQATPQERAMYAVGKKLFFMHGGPHDFACATCHGADNKRIRLQDVANLTGPGAGAAFGSWPAYRVSNGQLWSMQHRINDCYRQQRFPYLKFDTDAFVALSVYMGVNGKGVSTTAPAIKR